jgi:uncharacterized membrane protein
LSQIISANQNVEIKKQENSKNIINVFYVIGAIIAVIGIVILVVQNWSSIGLAGRIFVTSGVSLAAYIIGYLLKDEENKTLSQVLFTVSAVLAPVSTGVLLYEADVEVTPILVSIIALGWALFFGLALWGAKRNILILITTAFATVSIYSFVADLLQEYYYSNDLFKWLTVFIAVSYISIALNIENHDRERKAVQGFLYGFGTMGILGVLMSFSGVFNLITILVIFAAFYASVFLKSRIMLILSALFLIAHIIKITGQYFANSMNWAVALIFVGFLIIGIGYTTLYLNKKYISQR